MPLTKNIKGDEKSVNIYFLLLYGNNKSYQNNKNS